MSELVSVIIPVHNAEKFIKETVQSVLDQTYRDFELILVDDNSKDKSIEIIREIDDERIVIVEGKKCGSAAAARNAGVEVAKGRYITYLDADDLWRKDKLERTLNHLVSNNAAFVFTSYEFGDEEAKPTGKIVKVPAKLDYKHALTRTVIFTSTVMFDMNRLSKEDIYMPLVKSEDTALWWRILRGGVIAYGLNENLVTYRRSSNTLSSNKLEAMKRIWFLYRKMEGLSVIKSAFCFTGWAFRAVARRV